MTGDPLEVAPPSFSTERAAELARQVFGVEGTATPLDSERDQNFRLEGASGSFVFKIANPADDPDVLDMQTRAMLHVGQHAPDLPVMQPLRALSGDYVESVEGDDGSTYRLRLVTHMPGRMWDPTELSAEARAGFGAAVARLGIALRSFFHRAGGYDILWDLKHTPRLRPLIGSIPDPGRRALVGRVLDRFDENVAGVFPRLRAQLIHNDLTVDNVLLDESGVVSGIVDFGDLTHTALVCDLAISTAAMMRSEGDSLAAAVDSIAGYRSVLELEPLEAEVIADLIAARLAASATIAYWRVTRYPENAEYITAWEPFIWPVLEHLDELGWDRVQEVLRAASLGAPSKRLSAKELLDRRDRALGPALSPLTYDEPLYLVRGEGARLFDADGVEYLDAYNNVPVVGHANPHVVAAIAEQSALLNTNTRYLHESVIELAERLIATMPPGLDTVMFYNSGSEANDIAWRLATTFTGRDGALVTEHAYHGVTDATIALSPEEWVEPDGPSNVARVPPPDARWGSLGPDDYARAYVEAIDLLDRNGHGLAAFYIDSLFTSDGIYAPPPKLVTAALESVRSAAGLIVADEVQCGYGRSGSHLWSFERFDVAPDLVTLGKPMGNGHPVAAVITRREIAQRFADDIDLFSTFGGNPVAARAGLAVLDVIERDGLVENARSVGSFLVDRLRELGSDHAEIGDVRGAGLLIGIDIVGDRGKRGPDPERAHDLMNRMRGKRVLIGTTGPHGNVLKIRPPLVLTISDANEIAEGLRASLRD